MTLLRDKRILLGVSGGIAAYKAPQLIRELTRAGAEVRAVVTRSAAHFVAPLTLQVLSGAAVGTDLFDPQYEEQIGHIELARWADAILVAPATADLIGKMAGGLADDLLTTVLMATTAPIVVAPSMNTTMLQHPAVARNLATLEGDGVRVIHPDQGDLACRETGPGRQPDPEWLLDGLMEVLSPKPLAGRRVLVTAGPTREHLDPVRYFSNPSSGRMGFAMAQAAHHLGADVLVVCGPTHVATPPGMAQVDVETAVEMREAVMQAVASGLFMAVFAAAVADTRPAERSAQKRSKGSLGAAIAVERNPDILSEVAALTDNRPFCVGFAAETADLERATLAKCTRKGADLMIGNEVSEGGPFGAEDNRVIVVDGHDVLARIGPDHKLAVATEAWPIILDAHARRIA